MLKSFAGGSVFGASWGNGANGVLALHGWQRTHRDFEPVFASSEFIGDPTATVPGTATATAIDLFGFGATPAPPEAWGTAEYARRILPVLDELSPAAAPITVLGHSFGGRVAVRLAAMAPDRVGHLVLTGVPLLPAGGKPTKVPAARFRAGRRLHRMGLVGDERMEALRQRYGSPDYRAASGIIRQVLVLSLADEYGEDMAAVRCPVDLVWGEQDAEVPAEVAERARTMFPNASLRLLPGVGHMTPTEAPSALRDAVLG